MRFMLWIAVGMLVPTAPFFAQARNDSPDTIAGIPVHYDEDHVGTYLLPDALTFNNGKPVRDAKTWWKKRRPEVVAIFETRQYGRARLG